MHCKEKQEGQVLEAAVRLIISFVVIKSLAETKNFFFSSSVYFVRNRDGAAIEAEVTKLCGGAIVFYMCQMSCRCQ